MSPEHGIVSAQPSSALRNLRVFLGIVAGITVLVLCIVILKRSSNGEGEIDDNLKAVATLVAYDYRGELIGQGSGFFIDSKGLLVTNAHVVKGMKSVIAKIPSGAFYTLKEIRNVNQAVDVALLQFDAKETPSIVGIGNSDNLRAGEKVYAIGTPTGQEGTVSEGIISNPNREFGGQQFIQFTAAISPGSSGGGLFDESGKVIGITTQTINVRNGPEAGLAQNLNFAVPINVMKTVLSSKQTTYQGSASYYYLQGTIADRQKDWDRAIENYSKAIELDSSYVDAYIDLGGVYFTKGNYQLELQNYISATEVDPNNCDAFHYLATAYEDVGQYDKAFEAFKRALTIDPENKDVLHDYAILCLAAGDKDDATLLVDRLTELNPGWGKVLHAILRREK